MDDVPVGTAPIGGVPGRATEGERMLDMRWTVSSA
jgi:hypothetical protein